MEPRALCGLSQSDSPSLVSHSCVHCQTTLEVPSRLPQALVRIPFPQTINQAREASLDGCALFQQLLSDYCSRSAWGIFKTHWFRKCVCCHTWTQAFFHVVKSLSKWPFQLILVAELHKTRRGSICTSQAYLDCGNIGNKGTRFNAYTHTGTYDMSSTIILLKLISN